MKKLFLISILIITALTAKAQKAKADTSEVYTEVDKLPEFPGGQEKFNDYLNNKIKKTVRKRNTSGVVIVVSTVEKDGRFTNSKAIMSLNPEADSIAVGVVGKISNWKPAIKNGKPVRCKFSIPIRFSNPDPNDPPTVKERVN
jgi:hypothetical protein